MQLFCGLCRSRYGNSGYDQYRAVHVFYFAVCIFWQRSAVHRAGLPIQPIHTHAADSPLRDFPQNNAAAADGKR